MNTIEGKCAANIGDADRRLLVVPRLGCLMSVKYNAI